MIFVNSGEFFAAPKKRGELLAKKIADFRPLISRQSGRREFHEKSSTFSTRDKTNSFTARFWEWGAPKIRARKKPHKHFWVGRCSGQAGTIPGTNGTRPRDKPRSSIGQTDRFLFNFTVISPSFRKRRGVQKCMGHKIPWKIAFTKTMVRIGHF